MKKITTKKKFELKGFVSDEFPLTVFDSVITHDHILHSHDFIEIAFVERGQGIHTTKNTNAMISVGDVIIIPKGVRHGYKNIKDFVVVNVIFDISLLASPYTDLRHIPGFHTLFLLSQNNQASNPQYEFSSLEPDEITYAGRLVRKMKNELTAKAPGYKTVCLAALFELVSFLSRKEFKKTLLGTEHNLEKVLSYMEQHHSKKINIKELAKITSCSVRSFHRAFHKVTGKTPVDYLLNIRLCRAKNLLSSSVMSISEIAIASGVADSAYFAKQFKKLFRITPSEFRKNVSI